MAKCCKEASWGMSRPFELALVPKKGINFAIFDPIRYHEIKYKLMKIALAADHAGFEEKEKIKSTLDELGVEYTDMGTNSADSVDYPDYARKVGEAVARGEFDQGLLVCGSGTGMAIAANKVRGIRAAVAWSEDIARLARQHNDANVLSLPARFASAEESAKIVKAWFDADFEGGRHANRVEKITGIEKEDL
jgi:ribose 5-phosphate isomerase B